MSKCYLLNLMIKLNYYLLFIFITRYQLINQQSIKANVKQMDEQTIYKTQQKAETHHHNQQEELVQYQTQQQTKYQREQEYQPLQNYIISKTLGKGNFGKVKLATHKLTGQLVAVKILQKQLIFQKSDIVRISRQLKIMKLIRHPYVIQLYEIIQTPKQLYLIMQYAQNGDLFDKIVKLQRFNEQVATTIYTQIALGLQYLHDMGVTHRDLKPQNILISKNNTIKIADFGLGNMFKIGEKLKTACGSPCYAPPQMLNKQQYDPRKVDIWSSGIILYAMVCGYLPFQDKVTSKLYDKIKNTNYKLPSWVSNSCRNLIRGILAKDPSLRWDIEVILQHEFLINQVQKVRSVVQEKSINEQKLKQVCQKFQIEQQERLANSLKKNKHSNLTTLYYLGLKCIQKQKIKVKVVPEQFQQILEAEQSSQIKKMQNFVVQQKEHESLLKREENQQKIQPQHRQVLTCSQPPHQTKQIIQCEQHFLQINKQNQVQQSILTQNMQTQQNQVQQSILTQNMQTQQNQVQQSIQTYNMQTQQNNLESNNVKIKQKQLHQQEYNENQSKINELNELSSKLISQTSPKNSNHQIKINQTQKIDKQLQELDKQSNQRIVVEVKDNEIKRLSQKQDQQKAFYQNTQVQQVKQNNLSNVASHLFVQNFEHQSQIIAGTHKLQFFPDTKNYISQKTDQIKQIQNQSHIQKQKTCGQNLLDKGRQTEYQNLQRKVQSNSNLEIIKKSKIQTSNKNLNKNTKIQKSDKINEKNYKVENGFKESIVSKNTGMQVVNKIQQSKNKGMQVVNKIQQNGKGYQHKLKKSERIKQYKPESHKQQLSNLKLYERSHSKDRPILIKSKMNKKFQQIKSQTHIKTMNESLTSISPSSAIKYKKQQVQIIKNSKKGFHMHQSDSPKKAMISGKVIQNQPYLLNFQQIILSNYADFCKVLNEKGFIGKFQYYNYQNKYIYLAKQDLKLSTKAIQSGKKVSLETLILQINNQYDY